MYLLCGAIALLHIFSLVPHTTRMRTLHTEVVIGAGAQWWTAELGYPSFLSYFGTTINRGWVWPAVP